MKKLSTFIGVMIIVGIVGCYFAWPNTNLEKPIVMSVQMDEASKTLSVSYIVDKNDNTYVMEIGHNTKGFYPPRTSGYWDGITNYTNVLAAQNGYELREDVVELNEGQLYYFLSLKGTVLDADISFENYSPIKAVLILLKKDERANAIKHNETLHYSFTAQKDMTLNTIRHYHNISSISTQKDGEDSEFPLTLRKGNSVDIIIHNPYIINSKDKLLLEFITKNNQRISKNILMTESIPKGYLKKVVEEYNQ
ncbi:hypothetical protein ACFVP8_12355 [Viridibacillus arvi]|uniref:hypothetical protein n=1 Tax=Viridibacillus arvi TaxID=263475 RepID=UPI0036B5151B